MNERTRLFISIGGALALLALLVFVQPPIPVFLTSAAHTVATPLWEVENNMVSAVYGAFMSLDSKEALIADNQKLREEASKLRGEAFQTKLLEHENKKLKELLGRDTKANSDLLGVVLRTTDVAPYDALIIDVGVADGVREGDLVTTAGDIAIGSVRKVFSSTAIVVLFSAPQEKTMVLISGASSTVPVTAEGLGGGMFRASLPRAVGVTEGDPVFLAGLDSIIFAHVEKITVDPAAPFIEMLFRSPVNINEIEYLIVKRGSIWHPDVETVSTLKMKTSNETKDD